VAPRPAVVRSAAVNRQRSWNVAWIGATVVAVAALCSGCSADGSPTKRQTLRRQDYAKLLADDQAAESAALDFVLHSADCTRADARNSVCHFNVPSVSDADTPAGEAPTFANELTCLGEETVGYGSHNPCVATTSGCGHALLAYDDTGEKFCIDWSGAQDVPGLTDRSVTVASARKAQRAYRRWRDAEQLVKAACPPQ
jgi:hypothetical protein